MGPRFGVLGRPSEDEWELLPTTIASAGVDRFMHHAHIVVTEGDSYRFAEARDGEGVTPLTRTAENWCPSTGRSHGRLWGDPDGR